MRIFLIEDDSKIPSILKFCGPLPPEAHKIFSARVSKTMECFVSESRAA